MRFGAKAAAGAARDAQTRWAEGHTVHSVVVELESARAGAADDLSDVVQQVEAAGWRLDRSEGLAVAAAARPLVLLLFRRQG